ncbi:c-type cytochrome [Thalassobaculum salexigens]|uniref:c-type cytochrome n=1 Tax=Thalassobaculum salexigens TaxID=455360 RepID=UPI00248D8893|nr:cytochrome c [Thalassobaculum salexigens]
MRRFPLFAASAGLCALFAAALVPAPSVQAHDGATGIVKERMDLMKALGDDVKRLARMFKGETSYDPEAISAVAARIERRSGGDMLELFPEGSSGHPSEAKQDIWRHWPEFEAKADELATRASVLAAVADAGKGDARAAFGRLAGTRKACHQDFKED